MCDLSESPAADLSLPCVHHGNLPRQFDDKMSSGRNLAAPSLRIFMPSKLTRLFELNYFADATLSIEAIRRAMNCRTNGIFDFVMRVTPSFGFCPTIGSVAYQYISGRL